MIEERKRKPYSPYPDNKSKKKKIEKKLSIIHFP